ncbi:MAG: L-aspartate dehydrogenase [Desulfovibrio sp.]
MNELHKPKPRIGFLGCGKIGSAMLEDMLARGMGDVAFVQANTYRDEKNRFPVVRAQDADLLAQTDMVVESATPDALKAAFDGIMAHCDLMVFSHTAFADRDFEDHARKTAARYGRRIYLPHGAILGLDGIADGRALITEVSVVTTKSPASLGLQEGEQNGAQSDGRIVVYDGPTREACLRFPRNVNVHAAVALAGLGFDNTRSVIMADPQTTTNDHLITVKGNGVNFRIEVSSLATGGVTALYTPYSACACLAKVLEYDGGFRFI